MTWSLINIKASCGVTTSGYSLCWGSDNRGRAKLAGVPFASVSAGGYHTCGVTTSGDAFCWGDYVTLIRGPLNQ